MSDTDSLTLPAHLNIGRTAVDEIASLGEIPEEALWVCFRFFASDDAESDRWGDDARCVQCSRSIFEAMPFALSVDYHGGQVGIEAWERVRPNEIWLQDRLPRMIGVAEQCNMDFLGWSFEPRGFPFVKACPTVSVVDANTASGRLRIDEMIEEARQAGKDQPK